jgi:hypothetical protein
MNSKYVLTVLFSCACIFSNAADLEHQLPNPNEIRVVPVDPTPEPDDAEVSIIFPEDNSVKVNSPVRVQLKVEGYPLATDSEFPRNKEIFNSSKGQGIRVVLDERTYFIETEALIDADNDTENYYDQTVTFELPDLRPGVHILRAFPVRSFGESLKGDGCFAATAFYFQKKKDNSPLDLSVPYLTYNEPQGSFKTGKNKPVLLDFYIKNCKLSKDGYKVRLTIDGANMRILTQWVPYYIYGLSKGSHTLRLELLDPKNKVVSGTFNDFKQNIEIK